LYRLPPIEKPGLIKRLAGSVQFALSSEAVGVRTAQSLADRLSASARSVAGKMVSDAWRHRRAILELSRATGS
jgi:hypothetical protein